MKTKKTIALLAVASAVAAPVSLRSAELVAHWDFERVEANGTTIKASTGNYAGEISGSAVLTADGRPGGGKAFDGSSLANPGWLLIAAEGDDNPMNKAAAADQVTVVLWQKNNSNVNSSSFWAIGPVNDRAFQFHVPWSDGTIYFDTAGGCCATPGQRLSKNVVGEFPDHDWTAWHHYAFVKDGGAKAIYIDGKLLVEQTEGADELPKEYTQLTIGGQNNSAPPDAYIDDFAIFKGALTVDEIKLLAAGASPGKPPVDTDGDGMPDDWEKLYGFNPNDKADAALDFDKDGATNLEEYKAGTDPVDVTKPTIVSASATGDFKTINITFSEELDPAIAANAANYTIAPALAVSSVTYKKKVATLTTAAQTPGATAYTVSVKGVKDTSKNEIAADAKATVYSYILSKTGLLRFAWWAVDTTLFPDDVPASLNGASPIETLLDHPRYVSKTPNQVLPLFSFSSRDAFPSDAKENYGAILEGLVTPTEGGSYRFFIHSDDSSRLWLSTDDKEANLAQIAEETGCCGNFAEPGVSKTSEPIALVANKSYFIRLAYKEGGGGDYGRVAWRKEGDTTPAGSLQVIPGSFLTSAVELPTPPEGGFVTRLPADKAKNVPPVTKIIIAHRDGKTPWTSANVSLKLDGASVTPTFTKVGNVLTLEYAVPGILESKSVHSVALGYLDAGGNPQTSETTFAVATWNGSTKDKVKGYPGLITGSAAYTADSGGATGKAGDYGINLTLKGGPVVTYDPGFLATANAATAKDEFSVAFWQKKLDVADSSAFALSSPTAANNRIFHSHTPWSDQTIYFDTTGCCDAATQRISGPISDFADYTPADATFWTASWHFFAFTKKGSSKKVYIDGKLFLTGDSTNPLQTDADSFFMGAGGGGAELSHAIIDDFSVYGKELSAADALALAKGTLPSALPAANGLIAYWDFNDAIQAVAISDLKAAAVAGGKVKITFTGAGVIQSAAAVQGPYTDTAIKSGDEVATGGSAQFFKAKK